MPEVWAAVREHRQWLQGSGRLEHLRAQQRVAWLWDTVQDRLLTRVREHPAATAEVDALTAAVSRGEMTPGEAADRLLALAGLG